MTASDSNHIGGDGQKRDANPYAVELATEASCRWSEADVPLSERGVRFSWLCNFVRSIYWQRNEPVRKQLSLREQARQWEEYARLGPLVNPPTPDELKGVLAKPEPELYDAAVHELVAEHIVPLTKAIRAPLYARVPPSDRGKPEVFLSHAWANSVLSPVPQWHGGTLDAFDSEWPQRVTEEFVWIDFACYNQHKVAAKTIAFDIEATIRSIGNVAFAVTMTPLFDRIWCLWELLSASQTGARVRFCAPFGHRTETLSMVNRFFETIKSVKEAKATKPDDYAKLLAATISRFGSVAAADEIIRKLIRDETGRR